MRLVKKEAGWKAAKEHERADKWDWGSQVEGLHGRMQKYFRCS